MTDFQKVVIINHNKRKKILLYFRKEKNTRERDTSFSAKQSYLFVKSTYLILQAGIPKRYPLFLFTRKNQQNPRPLPQHKSRIISKRQLLSPPHPHPSPPNPLPQKHNSKRIQIMQLQSPKLCVMPPPQLSSHPQPQFVAAKSLMNKSSKNFDYTYILCE